MLKAPCTPEKMITQAKKHERQTQEIYMILIKEMIACAKILILNVYKLIDFLSSQKSSIELSQRFEQLGTTFF